MKKNSFLSQLKKTYKYASKKEKKHLFLFILDAIIICIIKIVIPLLAAKKIVYLTSSKWNQLFMIIIVILITEVLLNIIKYYSDKHFILYYTGTKKNLQMKLAKETLKINTKTMNDNSSGMFVSRMSSDVQEMTNIFIELIDNTASLITSIGVLIAIFFLNKSIFLLYLFFVIVLFITRYKKAESFQKVNQENRKIEEELTGFDTELVRGSKDIKLLNSENNFIKIAEKKIDKLSKSDFDLYMVWGKFGMLNGSIWDLVDFLIISVGIMFLIKGQISIPTMLVIVNYREEILNLSDIFQRLTEKIKKYKVSSKRVFDVIEGNKYPKEKFGNIHLNRLKGYIEFKNVTFGYEKNSKILDKMNFKINPNETVAFVGKSGVGKTTIYNLISKLYETNEGEILLDGTNINKLDKDTIRGNISVISQNPYIFNMSIKDNLKINEDVTDDEIISACKMAELHSFIVKQKDGYDTVVGESGVTLSGGQRQRLAIARALLQNTEIILFDEATSALDNETQSKIQKAIENMQGTYTILIIAHRLSTVINADKIFLVEAGKISAIGTHEQLLKTSEVYKNLYELELE